MIPRFIIAASMTTQAGARPSDSSRSMRRSIAGFGSAPRRGPPGALQPRGARACVLRRRREMRAEPNPPLHCPGDRRVGVALRHRPVTVVEVEQLVAVHVPDACTLTPIE